MRPHDLLRLKASARLVNDAAPAWVDAALASVPFVVVRRAMMGDGLVTIGVRGETRAERFASRIRCDDIAEIITPESLAEKTAWRATPRSGLPIFAAMDVVDQEAREIALTWGPGGSVGFELATRHPTVSGTSDLDVIIRPAAAHAREQLRGFRARLTSLPVRVDIAIEAAQGSAALDEWLASPGRVLIKTPDGPQLGALSW